jgi:hypothetical protein
MISCRSTVFPMQSIYDSVWGVVDVINNTPELDFCFPSIEQQEKIAAVFVQGVVPASIMSLGQYGFVIFTMMPSLLECEAMNCGKFNF